MRSLLNPKLLIVKFLFFVVVFALQTGFAAESTSRQTDIPSIAINQVQLAGIAERLNKLVTTANKGISCSPGKLMIEASDGSSGFTFNASSIRTELTQLPDTLFLLNISYNCFSTATPIRTVQIVLKDWYRHVQIEGDDPAQVDAVFSSVVTAFDRESSIFVGPKFRVFIGWIVVAFFLIVGALLINPSKPNAVRLIGLGVLCLSVPIGQWIPNWIIQMFPGFALYARDVSFATRYGPDMGLICFIAMVVGFAIRLLKKIVGPTQPAATP